MFTLNISIRKMCDVCAWLLVPDGLLLVFRKLLISCNFPKQQSLEFAQNGVKSKKHPVSLESAAWNSCLCERSEENDQTDQRWQDGYSNSNNRSIAVSRKGPSVSTPFSHEQESEPLMGTLSLKLDFLITGLDFFFFKESFLVAFHCLYKIRKINNVNLNKNYLYQQIYSKEKI